jgi:cardiolipin synthase
VLSLLRLASVPVFVFLFVTGREDAAVILFAIGAWTDFFDGYIARRMGSVTELGKLLDPLADRVLIVALTVALVARDILPLWLAITVIGRDLVVLSVWPLLERRGVERIRVNFVGKSATAALLAGLTLLAISVTSFSFADQGEGAGMFLVVLGAILYWTAGYMYARQAVALIKVSRTPPG